MKHAITSFAFLSLFIPLLAFSNSGLELQKIAMPENDFAKVTEGQKTIDLNISDNGLLMDGNGREIQHKDMEIFLSRNKFDKNALYVLWIKKEPNPADKQIDRLAEILASYGVTKIVVRKKQSIPPSEADAGKDAAAKSPAKRVLVLKGEPNPKSKTSDDKMPSMDGRPNALKPGPLPSKIRYIFEPDATVVVAAKRLEKYLADGNAVDATIFKDSLLVFSGAWKIAKSSGQFEKTDAKIIRNMLPFGSKVFTFECCLMQNADELDALGKYIRQLIQNDGGASIRALTSAEMAKWWMFIGFDIEEPVFTVESKGGKYLFIFSFSSETPGRLSLIDELNALPDAYDLRSSALEQ